jgi:hypothetical protein
MTLGVAAAREAREALRGLDARLQGDTLPLEPLLEEYTRARRVLARVFQEAAVGALDIARYDLAHVKERVTARLHEVLSDLLPTRVLTVSGYQSPHPLLYGYLAEHHGQRVPSWRLRVLTADQVHTERRVRDLRDLGLDVVEEHDDYVLTSPAPDVDLGVVRIMDLKLKRRPQLATAEVRRRLEDLR